MPNPDYYFWSFCDVTQHCSSLSLSLLLLFNFLSLHGKKKREKIKHKNVVPLKYFDSFCLIEWHDEDIVVIIVDLC